MSREPAAGEDPMRGQNDELTPDTEPKGRLDPPRTPPPTAVGAGTPDEDQPERRPAELYDRVRLQGRARRPPLPIRFIGSLIGGLQHVIKRSRQMIRR